MAQKAVLRQPIVVVLGHVDHGKTTLLDKIRGTAVALREVGGMTQHIGSSFFPLDTLREICGPILRRYRAKIEIPGLLIIDTPGHEVFFNLRRRGGSVADIAILVIDVIRGLEVQTYECLDILSSRKTPFLIAANKIDLIPGWKSIPNASFAESWKNQDPFVRRDLDERIYTMIGALSRLGLNADRFDRVKDFTRYAAIIPVSAKTGEGIPELLSVLIGLAQQYMKLKLLVSGERAMGTTLEVKEEAGLGTTVNAVIYDGTLSEGDFIILGGKERPIFTRIRALLLPKPLDEMRDPRDRFTPVEEVSAATGVKIVAPLLENAIAGAPLSTLDKAKTKKIKGIYEELRRKGIPECEAIESVEKVSDLAERAEKVHTPIRKLVEDSESLNKSLIELLKTTCEALPERIAYEVLLKKMEEVSESAKYIAELRMELSEEVKKLHAFLDEVKGIRIPIDEVESLKVSVTKALDEIADMAKIEGLLQRMMENVRELKDKANKIGKSREERDKLLKKEEELEIEKVKLERDLIERKQRGYGFVKGERATKVTLVEEMRKIEQSLNEKNIELKRVRDILRKKNSEIESEKIELKSGIERAIGLSETLLERSRWVDGLLKEIRSERLLEESEELKKIRSDVSREVEEILVSTDQIGLVVKADTLGSLEAILNQLKIRDFPIRKADIGDVSKQDAIEAMTVKKDAPLQGVILAFNVKILPDAEEELKSRDVKVFQSDVVYRLIEDYVDWVKREQEAIVRREFDALIKPGKIRFLPDYIFRRSEPAIIGIKVLSGTIKPGYKLIRSDLETVGEIMQIQDRGQAIPKATTGMEVAISMREPVVGRDIREGDILFTYLPEDHARLLFTKYRSKLTPSEDETLEEIASLIRKKNPYWGM